MLPGTISASPKFELAEELLLHHPPGHAGSEHRGSLRFCPILNHAGTTHKCVGNIRIYAVERGTRLCYNKHRHIPPYVPSVLGQLSPTPRRGKRGGELVKAGQGLLLTFPGYSASSHHERLHATRDENLASIPGMATELHFEGARIGHRFHR